jgi:hypothetical protein
MLTLMVASAWAWVHPVLDKIPSGLLANPAPICTYADRLVVARIVGRRRGPGSTLSLVRLRVVRQVNVGPPVEVFTMVYPGKPGLAVVGFPVPNRGRTLALVLNYPDNDFTNPSVRVLAPVFEVPDDHSLPPNAELDLAFRELCGSLTGASAAGARDAVDGRKSTRIPLCDESYRR